MITAQLQPSKNTWRLPAEMTIVLTTRYNEPLPLLTLLLNPLGYSLMSVSHLLQSPRNTKTQNNSSHLPLLLLHKLDVLLSGRCLE